MARARRRGAPVGPWLRWSLATALPFAVTVAGRALPSSWSAGCPDSVEEAVAPATRRRSARRCAPLARARAPVRAVVGRACAASRWATCGRGACRARAPPRRSRCCCRSRCWSCARSTRSPALLLVPGGAPVPAGGAVRERRAARCWRAAMVAGALALPVLALLYYGARFDLGPVAGQLRADGGIDRRPVRSSSAVLGSLVAGSLTSSALLAMGGGRAGRSRGHGARPGDLCGPRIAGRDGVGAAALTGRAVGRGRQLYPAPTRRESR